VLVEALAMGLPIVSTDCAATRELLGDGAFGQLVMPSTPQALSEAMHTALNDIVDAEVLKARAAEFAPDVAVERYLRLMLDKCA
jgi:glycosyltransferase involved in cell wall biosynthesis